MRIKVTSLSVVKETSIAKKLGNNKAFRVKYIRVNTDSESLESCDNLPTPKRFTKLNSEPLILYISCCMCNNILVRGDIIDKYQLHFRLYLSN